MTRRMSTTNMKYPGYGTQSFRPECASLLITGSVVQEISVLDDLNDIIWIWDEEVAN